jgi:hypothetical protein
MPGRWQEKSFGGRVRGAEAAGFVGGEVGEGFSHPVLAAELEAELGRVGGAGVESDLQVSTPGSNPPSTNSTRKGQIWPSVNVAGSFSQPHIFSTGNGATNERR